MTMQKLEAGKTFHIRQKLIGAFTPMIVMSNATKHDVMFELEENVDGVKPSLAIKIRRIIKKGRKKR